MTDSKFATFGGSLKSDVLTFNPDALPEPDTLCIFMTRGNGADEFRKRHGNIRRVIIDVEGEKHEFSADSLIRLLEGLEGASDDR